MAEYDLTNLVSILLWIMAGPGAVVVANLLISWLAANSVGWNNLKSGLKFVLMLLIAPALAILAQVIVGYTDFINAFIQPWFQIAMVAAIGWIATQTNYNKMLSSGYKKTG